MSINLVLNTWLIYCDHYPDKYDPVFSAGHSTGGLVKGPSMSPT